MITINPHTDEITVEEHDEFITYKIGSPEGFALLSKLWLRSGWINKQTYSFTWLGRPIIQLPEDMFRLQEVIYDLKPDVIIETGIAHGGSLIFSASLCKLMGKGRVIGVDIEIRAHNKQAIANHDLSRLITMIEGDSTAPEIVQTVKALVRPDETVLVLLDSLHTKAHVLSELNVYSSLVSVGSYIVVFDGIMELVAGAPRTNLDWSENNPRQACLAFVAGNPNFVIETPAFTFNESLIQTPITYAPDGYIKRIK
jgi:cephalosporin hydroxylase